MDNEEESVIDALPPPRKSDVLFGSGVACVRIEEEWVYRNGYRRAAQQLAKYACEAGREGAFLDYPIVYLYRHHIELTLKSIIESAAFVIDYTLTEKDLDTLGRHDLVKLWNLAKPMLNPACSLGGFPALPPGDLEGIDPYINQLHQHDPDGQRFRYSTTKVKGQKARWLPSLPADLTIDISNFGVGMEKLSDYLDGLEWEICNVVDAKIEYHAQRRRMGIE